MNKKCNFHFFGGFSEQKIQIQIRRHFLLIAVSGALELLCLGAGRRGHLFTVSVKWCHVINFLGEAICMIFFSMLEHSYKKAEGKCSITQS